MAWTLEVDVITSMLVRLRALRPGHCLAWLAGDLGPIAQNATRLAGARRMERHRMMTPRHIISETLPKWLRVKQVYWGLSTGQKNSG